MGHQSETKCILLARESVFWPGISNDIRQIVKDWGPCNHLHPIQSKLPIMQPDLPTRPWEKLGTDIFKFNDDFFCVGVMYSGEYDVCDVTLSVYPHRASLKNMPGHGGNRIYDLWNTSPNVAQLAEHWG